MITEEVLEKFLKCGPTRVVIDAEGEAWPSRRAREEHHITPDIVFFRKDGWSLGAPAEFASVAEAMWQDEWVSVWRRGCEAPEPYVK